MPKIDLETYEAIRERSIGHGTAVLAELGLDPWFEIKIDQYGDSLTEETYFSITSKPEFDVLLGGRFDSGAFYALPPLNALESIEESILAWEQDKRTQLKRRISILPHLRPAYLEALVKLNLAEGIVDKFVSYIAEVTLGNFFAIRQAQTINLGGTKEVYFLGENGDGKTLVLLGMHLAFNRKQIESQTNEAAGAAKDLIDALKSKLSKAPDVLTGAENSQKGLQEINESGLELKGKGIQSGSFAFDKKGPIPYLLNFFAYGANRNRCDAENFDRTGFMSLYNSRIELYSPIALLKQAYVMELEHIVNLQKDEAERKLLPKWLPVKQIERLFSDLLDGKVTVETSLQFVRFKEKGAAVEFEQMSEGFKCILIWVADLLYRLQSAQPLAGDLQKYRGIVMVDEIELHLHPSWQTTLVNKLRKYFPGIQFIFTTHSPTMIQGASEDAVIFKVARSMETGATTISEPYFKKDLDHMMFNTLMTSPLFGLESARISPQTEDPDTSNSYLSSRVSKQVESRLQAQKKAGKPLMSEAEIDALVNEVLNLELNK
jgi:hypothetical protein